MGECVINTVWILGCRHLEIVRADERVRIADEVLAGANEHPDVSYGDGILTIRAINGTVSHGIGPYDLLTNTYEAVRSPDLEGPLDHAQPVQDEQHGHHACDEEHHRG